MIRYVLGFLGAGMCATAFAAYTNASPPPGIRSSGGALYASAAANGPWVNGAASGNVTVNVGGRLITAPARWRMAANAGRFIIQQAALHPAVRTAAFIAWIAEGGFAWDRPGLPGWSQVPPPSSCLTGNYPDGNACLPVGESLAICSAWAAGVLGIPGTTCEIAAGNPNVVIMRRGDNGNPHTSWGVGYVNNPGGGPAVAVPSTDIENWGDDNPPPDEVPNSVPQAVPSFNPDGTPGPGAIPIEIPPTIQPGEAPDYAPEPRRYPGGDPYLDPTPDPPVWREPYNDVWPSPTPGWPWRVDVRPGSRTSPGDDPAPVPIPPTGEPISGGSPTPSEQVQLCEAFPDISACQPLGTPPDASPAGNVENRELEIENGPIFGPENAACPAPRIINTGLAGPIEFSYEGACMFADGIRPVVVGLAFLASVLMFFGIGKRED